jgi:hypothetical protein
MHHARCTKDINGGSRFWESKIQCWGLPLVTYKLGHFESWIFILIFELKSWTLDWCQHSRVNYRFSSFMHHNDQRESNHNSHNYFPNLESLPPTLMIVATQWHFAISMVWHKLRHPTDCYVLLLMVWVNFRVFNLELQLKSNTCMPFFFWDPLYDT